MLAQSVHDSTGKTLDSDAVRTILGYPPYGAAGRRHESSRDNPWNCSAVVAADNRFQYRDRQGENDTLEYPGERETYYLASHPVVSSEDLVQVPNH
jgi:hypothetical protein